MFKKIFTVGYNLPGYFYLKNKCKKEGVDFIYERYALYNYVGIKVAQDLNIPLVLEVNAPFAHEVEEHEEPLFPKLAKEVEKNIFNKADVIVVISKSLKKYLVRIGVRKDKIVVMHNGVNFNKFDYNISGTEIREKYDLNDKIVIGFVGGLEPHHGLEMLFKAVSQLEEMENVALLMVGNGSCKRKLEKLANNLNLNVIFTGRVSHSSVPNYIAAMDITVKPDANSYCSPMKAFEYMAMKKPIIACKTDSIKEIITNKKNGLLVNSNLESLKIGVKKLILDRQLAEKIANNGYEYIKKNYSWEQNAQTVVDLVKELNSNILDHN